MDDRTPIIINAIKKKNIHNAKQSLYTAIYPTAFSQSIVNDVVEANSAVRPFEFSQNGTCKVASLLLLRAKMRASFGAPKAVPYLLQE